VISVLGRARTATAEPGFQLAKPTGAGHAIAALLPGEPAHRVAASGISSCHDGAKHCEQRNRNHRSYGNGHDLCRQPAQHVRWGGKHGRYLEPLQGEKHGCQQPQ
jgi:hypothetical protein